MPAGGIRFQLQRPLCGQFRPVPLLEPDERRTQPGPHPRVVRIQAPGLFERGQGPFGIALFQENLAQGEVGQRLFRVQLQGFQGVFQGSRVLFEKQAAGSHHRMVSGPPRVQLNRLLGQLQRVPVLLHFEMDPGAGRYILEVAGVQFV